MYIDGDTLYLEFKKRTAENNRKGCLDFLNCLLGLSVSAECKILKNGRSSKMLSQTNKIRQDIAALVNKDQTTPATINQLVVSIRGGFIQKINATFGAEIIVVSRETDFSHLLTKYLLKK